MDDTASARKMKVRGGECFGWLGKEGLGTFPMSEARGGCGEVRLSSPPKGSPPKVIVGPQAQGGSAGGGARP